MRARSIAVTSIVGRRASLAPGKRSFGFASVDKSVPPSTSQNFFREKCLSAVDGISCSQGSRHPLSGFDRESRTQVLADAGRPCTSAKNERPCQPQLLPERKR